MRILVLDQYSTMGGGQQCLLDLLPAMLERGWTVHAGLPAGGPLALRAAELGAHPHQIHLGQYTSGAKHAGDAVRFAFEAPRLAREIRSLVRQHRIDLLYVNGPRLLPAASCAGCRVLFHSHNLLQGVGVRALAGLSLRGCHASVIASSQFVAAPLRPYVQPAVIYNGVTDRRAGTRPRCCSLELRIGIVGRIAPEKGHLDFLRMAGILMPTLPRARFVVCGDGQHSADGFPARVRALATGLPVGFLEWQADIVPVLSALDVVVLPSAPVEATPRVIMEAFSAGVPVVAYASGGIPELIDSDTNGVLTRERTPESMAESILTFVQYPERAARLSRSARRTYEARFTLDRFQREVCEVVEWPGLPSRIKVRKATPASNAVRPAKVSTIRYP